ncbi:MAG: rRNA maturation RNase YbeY [Bacteroidia bacterium]|nr:rRNA maturation RNase YbeY [Bacteroidia bacterium]
MSISFVAEGVKRPKLSYRIISRWLKQVVVKFGYISGDLTYIFCDDEFLKDINIKYLKHDFYTDIVTFDYSKDLIVSGDMFISINRVKENSEIFKCDLNDEFLRVIIHGLLHLLEYTDSDNEGKEIMRKIENEYILLYKEICNECIK